MMTELYKEMILYLQDVLWFLSKDKIPKVLSEMIRVCFLALFKVVMLFFDAALKNVISAR